MDKSEVATLFVVLFLFTVLFIQFLNLFVVFFLDMFLLFFTLLIVRRIKYGKTYGKYKIPTFGAVFIDPHVGTWASFAQSDWQALTEPMDLIHIKSSKFHKIDEDGNITDENVTLTLDFPKIYEKCLNYFWSEVIPNPPELDEKIRNFRGQYAEQTKKYYFLMSLKQRQWFAFFLRQLIGTQISLEHAPKVQEICSLSAGLHIIFFADSQPSAYAIHKKKIKFRKWRALPWQSGFPIVHMWAQKLEGYRKEVSGHFLQTVIAMPIMDEHFQQQKYLNLARHTITTLAMSQYAQEATKFLPYLRSAQLMQERIRTLETSKAVLMRELSRRNEFIGELSELAYGTTTEFASISGMISKVEGLPKELIERFKQMEEKTKKKVGRIETIKRRILRKKEAEEEKVVPVPPSITET